MKLLGVDNGDGCVKPSKETIPSGEYTPLSRPLFIYVNKSAYKTRPEVKTFVDYYMQVGPDLTNEVGYVSSSEAVYDNNKSLLMK